MSMFYLIGDEVMSVKCLKITLVRVFKCNWCVVYALLVGLTWQNTGLEEAQSVP